MRATFKSKSLLLHGATVLPSKWERNKKFGAAPTMVVWVVKFSNGRFNIHRKLLYFVNRHSTAPSHHKLIIIFRSQSVSELNWSTNVNSKKYTPKLKIVFESHIFSFDSAGYSLNIIISFKHVGFSPELILYPSLENLSTHMTIALTGFAKGNEQTPCLKPDYKKSKQKA